MPPEVTLFVDETYLGDGGEIQAGFAVPVGCMDGFNEAVDKLLAGPPKQPLRCFHGRSIRPRNLRLFERFLQYGANVCALVGEATPLRSVVTLRGPSADTENIQWLQSQVEPAAAEFAVLPVGLLREVIKQALWIHENIRHVCPLPVPNPFRLVFDSKHSYASEMRRERLVLSDRRLETLTTASICTAISNSVLQTLARGTWCPYVSAIEYLDDRISRPLQFADLLAHLTYNALLCELGHSTKTAVLKHSLLRRVQPEPPPLDILDQLGIENGALVCRDTSVRLLTLLGPMPAIS